MVSLIHQTADVDEDVTVGDNVKIWHHVQIRNGAQIGSGSIIGRGAYVGTGVHVGNNCKIQNYALLYEPAHLEEGVFVGPAVVFTNDLFPRAITPSLKIKDPLDWKAVGVIVRQGASIGARAVCIAPITIGRWAMVAAGAVVTKDVPDFALMMGIPAKQVAWVGKQGQPLLQVDIDTFQCPVDGTKYHLISPTSLQEI